MMPTRSFRPFVSRRSNLEAVLISILGTLVVRAPASAQSTNGPTPPAEDDIIAGQRLFDEGLVRYDTAEYDEAVRLFRGAYEKTHAPAVLFNMAQAYRLRGDCVRAADLYRNFVRLAPESPNRARAESWMAALGDCNKNAEVSGHPPETATPRSQEACVVDASARPSPILASPRPAVGSSRRSRYAQSGGLVLIGAAVSLSVGSAYFARRSADDAAEISALFRRGGTWDAQAVATDTDGRRSRAVAGSLLLIAGATAVAGVAAYLYGRLVDRTRKD